jgi:hypothetical protein
MPGIWGGQALLNGDVTPRAQEKAKCYDGRHYDECQRANDGKKSFEGARHVFHARQQLGRAVMWRFVE